MATRKLIDWSDVKSAAEEMAGNWQAFDCFVWHRANDVDVAEAWMIYYTSGRDQSILELSNEAAIGQRLEPFALGDDPDVVFEQHSHWAVGHLNGFSMRVHKADGNITPAFEEFCRIQKQMADYPVLNEDDYADREYEGTLENYRSEMWGLREQLPKDWDQKVYSWFSDNGHEQFIESRDDRGGWAQQAKIVEALEALGLLPQQPDLPIIVTTSAK